MRHEFYLLSIIPNQQTRLKLQSLRHHLFQTHGLASALAFEPVIPLAWFEAPVDSSGYARFSTGAGGIDTTVTKSTDKLPQQPLAPRIEFGEPKLWASHLYISVVMQPEGLLQELILASGQSPLPGCTTPEGGSPPIPAAEGIFLAANETELTGTQGVGHRSGADVLQPTLLQPTLLQTAENRLALLAQQFSADRSLESTRIGMYSLRFSPDFHRWWEHVEWTLEWKIQLKRA
ncbi:MAG: hypothetical protein K9L66_06130 [Spirochaetaceae bacterium]|nr:hypothetical protein [Spirochaetaceae bacterium]MCF7948695.1 hypothetical protein [Spirochaetia bacterium]MCF7951159.1 hypothetical protein [Spirochaetaceae bacterium]